MHPQCSQTAHELRAEAFRWVMCDRPAAGSDELLLARRKALEILKVLAAGTSICCRVDLESHLVDTTYDVKDQRVVLLLLRASGKALRQAKLK